MATAASRRDEGTLDLRTRNAVRGAFIGFFVDMFDIYLPIVVLAPAMAYFISPSMPETMASIVGASIFAATLVGRPLGALIFGPETRDIGFSADGGKAR